MTLRSPELERRVWLERVRLVGEIVAVYIHTRRALGRAPIAVVLERLRAPVASAPAAGEDPLAQARHLGSAVARTLAVLPVDARCLARSLVLTRLLARRGIASRLVIATHPGPEFTAHAWVEHNGHPVLSPGDGSFGRLVEL